MNVRFYNQFSFAILLAVLVSIGIFCNVSCSKRAETDQPIVASVGDKSITAKDFRYNYEFGFPHLKQGDDPKRTYLEFMINEELLALAGYQQGLDRSESVKKLESELTEELYVEELFKKEVSDKIEVSTEEIRDAITKASVKWKLRYWVEPTLDYANSVCQAMRKDGYAAVVDRILKSNPEVKMKQEDFNTDYLTWLDVPPEVLDKIKDLPAGEISDPVEMNDAFFLFQIVDIRREPLSEYDIQTQTDKYRKILSSRKENEKTKQFVSQYMTPKDVVTKGYAFRILANALVEWNKKYKKLDKSFVDGVQSEENENSPLYILNKEKNNILITFNGGKWTIEDFIKRFNENSIQLDSTDVASYHRALNQQIALKIRNYFFSQEVKTRGLDKAPTIRKQLELWRDKWVYEQMRKQYTKNLVIDDDDARQYFNRHKDDFKNQGGEKPTFSEFAMDAKNDTLLKSLQFTLAQKIDSLRKIYPVVINEAVLDTIHVLESQKSKGINMQVYKRSSNRLSRPIVDPTWDF
ncbi:peptidyl-prolyl cis-trans isomerase [candidate division KSB1 bacterium]|nr:peptidyl-prolyl cis-trans isomerase [candidate division KSB1 bacterium]